eukprot:jgi/Bigna1/91826/estExt_fgenesh1_pg.C_1220016
MIITSLTKVGWVDVGSIAYCGPQCSKLQIAELQDWQSKLKRRPFTPSKIKVTALSSSRSSRSRGASSKRLRSGNLDLALDNLSRRPLRRSRRHENTMNSVGDHHGGASSSSSMISRIYEMKLIERDSRIMNLETHCEKLIEYNANLIAATLAAADITEKKIKAKKGGGITISGVAGEYQPTAETSVKMDVVEKGEGGEEEGKKGGENDKNHNKKEGLKEENEGEESAPTTTSKQHQQHWFLPEIGGGELPLAEKKPTSKVATVMCLEVEILARIVAFLDISERAMLSSVCSLYSTPLLNQNITKIDFFNVYESVTDKVLMSMACRHTEIESLCLEHCEQLTDKSVSSLTQHFRKELKYVNLSFCPLLTDKSVQALEKCRHLKTLMIQGCPKVSSAALKRIANSTRDLLPGHRRLLIRAAVKRRPACWL